MATRLPASQRTREELKSLIEGRLSTASAKDDLVKLATRLIVEEALEGESGDVVGRDYYEHGAAPGQGYRNGYRTGRLKTAEGLMEYSAPQVAGRDEAFRSTIREHLKGHTQGLEDLAIEMLARGLSVRDIEDAFRDETGRLLLSKTAVSEIGERLVGGLPGVLHASPATSRSSSQRYWEGRSQKTLLSGRGAPLSYNVGETQKAATAHFFSQFAFV